MATKSPLEFHNNLWRVENRLDFFRSIGLRFHDDDVEKLRQVSVKVLKEIDRQLDTAKPVFAGESFDYSDHLREGLAESLAILATNQDLFSSCSLNKPADTAKMAVRKILTASQDWQLWASLDRLLPLLAEAAPQEFLAAVQTALDAPDSPFEQIFNRESSGVLGQNFMSGLLWALEVVAWDEDSLVGCTVILGELARIDPGGNWSNRPINTLIETFLPWYPQTLADFEKRKSAINALANENGDVAFDLVLGLLPTRGQMTTGNQKPKYRAGIPEEPDVSQPLYQEQLRYFADRAFELSSGNIGRLIRLSTHLYEFDDAYLQKFTTMLKADWIRKASDAEVEQLWNDLSDVVGQQKKLMGSNDVFVKLAESIQKLSPEDPARKYKRLFVSADFDLFDGEGDWDEQRGRLDEARKNAVNEILDSGGYAAVSSFASTVEVPWNVGRFLARLNDGEFDLEVIQLLVETEDVLQRDFCNGYLMNRFLVSGEWKWFDEIDVSELTAAETAKLLCSMPRTDQLFERVDSLLGEDKELFWTRVSPNPYQDQWDLAVSAKELLAVERSAPTIMTVRRLWERDGQEQKQLAVDALMLLLQQPNSLQQVGRREIVGLLKLLQEKPESIEDKLLTIEYAFIALLDGQRSGARPITLERELASDPEFFHQVISSIFKPRNHPKPNEASPEEVQRATNLYRLLRKWSVVPGTDHEGKFHPEQFDAWLKKVKKLAKASDHLEASLSTIGQVLINSPADPSGLWIHDVIASALNKKGHDKLRSGYRTGKFNERGAHWVDPEAKPELELVASFARDADAVEAAGYHRFAGVLRDLADTYQREADRILNDPEMQEHRDSSSQNN